ncbi:hypothetical protein DERF_008465 [Dermatophagoides farinae]|uniref:Uncharacterized protein n=1 Tax=Dermatophagoides farinae TaxID=6954 RepID=A0A922L973_DERFA|nr:hypothetical protein DERF_008465 [Dermatophagoides farinae]
MVKDKCIKPSNHQPLIMPHLFIFIFTVNNYKEIDTMMTTTHITA